jgi:hypothetical protein
MRKQSLLERIEKLEQAMKMRKQHLSDEARATPAAPVVKEMRTIDMDRNEIIMILAAAANCSASAARKS